MATKKGRLTVIGDFRGNHEAIERMIEALNLSKTGIDVVVYVDDTIVGKPIE